MLTQYPQVIQESFAELSALEKDHRGTRVTPRIQLLRLLKSGEKRSLPQAARTVGYSRQQAERWWKCYREGGLTALLEVKTWGGSKGYMTPEAWAGLQARLETGDVLTLEQVREYLQDEWKVEYKGVAGVSALFRRQGIKKKTGRRRHRKADVAEQAAFKKTSAISSPTPKSSGSFPLMKGVSD